MEVRIGRYILRSDYLSMWIEEEYVSEKTGKADTKRVAGYSPTFELLLNSFYRNKVNSVSAKTVEGLLRALSKIEKEMLELNEAAVKEDFKLVRKEARRTKKEQKNA